MDTIRIQLMDKFTVYINELQANHLAGRSRKGIALMQFLILNRGRPVPNQRLLNTLWPEDKSRNPESALKTLISRMRSLLNQLSPDLSKCIIADGGAYRWENQPNITVDLFEIDEIFAQLAIPLQKKEQRKKLYVRLMELYVGDLLQNDCISEWVVSQSMALHNEYLSAVYSYIDLLKDEDNQEEIINVCRLALEIDSFNDQLHMELMSALIKMNRANEAMLQYKHVMNLHYRYLGIQPSEDLQEFYKQIAYAGKNLDLSMESIRRELCENNTSKGAFLCEYVVFKEIFNLQMRNLERLGTTMFLAVIMISSLDGQALSTIKLNGIMTDLEEMLRANLRKGDTITHFSPTSFALLLPTVNYASGDMVLNRIKRLFYQKYPNSNVVFDYHIEPLSNGSLNESQRLPNTYS